MRNFFTMILAISCWLGASVQAVTCDDCLQLLPSTFNEGFPYCCDNTWSKDINTKFKWNDATFGDGSVWACTSAGAGGNARVCPKPVQVVSSVGGDPVTHFEGRATRFWLPTHSLTCVFKQFQYAVEYRAGPVRTIPELSRRGDWVVQVEVHLGGASPETIHIEVVDPDQQDHATAFPVLGSPLTTIRLSVGAKQLVVGTHSLSAGAVSVSAAPLGKSSKIGSSFVERIEIKGDGIHMRITSAKAQKFSSEAQQIQALHLDCEFVKFNRTAARGSLPEMWGLQPLSQDTVLMLVPPKVETKDQGSIIDA